MLWHTNVPYQTQGIFIIIIIILRKATKRTNPKANLGRMMEYFCRIQKSIGVECPHDVALALAHLHPTYLCWQIFW